MKSVLLEMIGITKQFPGVRALDNVSFEVRGSEVHALVGENGAGKSTLVKILSGAYQRDAGEIILRGTRVDLADPHQAQELGISTIHQELMLVPELTVAENIFLGRQPTRRLGTIVWKDMSKKAGELLGTLGLDLDPRELVKDLSVAYQQMVEIAKALSIEADIIIMDEPTSSLAEHETEMLFEVIARVKSQGVGVIYISHKIEEVFRVADRVTVLCDGRYVGTLEVADGTPTQIVRMMVGRDVSDLYQKQKTEIGIPVLEVRDLSREGVLRNVTFKLHRGEILGISGLVGAGRTNLARCIFGIDPKDSGEVYMEGRKVNITSPRDAIRLGLGLAPEDRKEQALILEMAVWENITLAQLCKTRMWGLSDKRHEREVASKYVSKLDIKTPSLDQEVLYLPQFFNDG